MDTMNSFTFCDEAEAQHACGYWQKELGLSDWDIQVRFVRWTEIKQPDNGTTDADILYLVAAKEAIIQILVANDYYLGKPLRKQDMEFSLVHELEHLFNYDWKDKHDQQEQMNNANAKTLVRLRRLAYPESPWRTANQLVEQIKER